MSDLHVDTAPYGLPATPLDVDVLVIAGDVADGHHKSARWLRQHAVTLGFPVIYVCGNHDFYGHDLREGPVQLMSDIGVELLHVRRPSVVIAGTRFVGSTLWTDYAIAGDVDAARAWGRRYMPDMTSIDLGLRRVGTRDLLEAHQRHRSAIETELADPFPGQTIVVTHHAPHPKSLRSPAMITPDDGSYASDLSAIIEEHEPAVWVHGHVHSSNDYYVSATRVVCNPRGYDIKRQGKLLGNASFDSSYVVEI